MNNILPVVDIAPCQGGSFTTSTAVFATLAKDLTEYLLRDEDTEDDED